MWVRVEAVEDGGTSTPLCIWTRVRCQWGSANGAAVQPKQLSAAYRASQSRARMHSFNARRLLLISAPSNRVCLSLSYVSVGHGCLGSNWLQLPASEGKYSLSPAPRSLPAKSMNESLPTATRGHALWVNKAEFSMSQSTWLRLGHA